MMNDDSQKISGLVRRLRSCLSLRVALLMPVLFLCSGEEKERGGGYSEENRKKGSDRRNGGENSVCKWGISSMEVWAWLR